MALISASLLRRWADHELFLEEVRVMVRPQLSSLQRSRFLGMNFLSRHRVRDLEQVSREVLPLVVILPAALHGLLRRNNLVVIVVH